MTPALYAFAYAAAVVGIGYFALRVCIASGRAALRSQGEELKTNVPAECPQAAKWRLKR